MQTARRPAKTFILFRDYEPRDFAQICELDRLCFAERIAYSPEEIALSLSRRGAFSIVAEADGRVAGFIIANIGRRGSGHIVTIDVHPDFRRRAIGNQLMELAEQRLRAAGVPRVLLEVATHNSGALAFYTARGYATLKLLPHYYADGTNAYLMEKLL